MTTTQPPSLQEERVLEALALANAPVTVGRVIAGRIVRGAGIRISAPRLADILQRRRTGDPGGFGLTAATVIEQAAPVVNPLAELQALAGQVVAWKDVLQSRVGFMAKTYTTDDKGVEQVKAEIALYERAIDRAERVLVNIARLNLDERLANIEQAQAEMMALVLDSVLRKFGLDPNETEVRRAVYARLLELEAVSAQVAD